MENYLKYLKAAITYEHDIRVETYPFAREAVREACYELGVPAPEYTLLGDPLVRYIFHPQFDSIRACGHDAGMIK